MHNVELLPLAGVEMGYDSVQDPTGKGVIPEQDSVGLLQEHKR